MTLEIRESRWKIGEFGRKLTFFGPKLPQNNRIYERYTQIGNDFRRCYPLRFVAPIYFQRFGKVAGHRFGRQARVLAQPKANLSAFWRSTSAAKPRSRLIDSQPANPLASPPQTGLLFIHDGEIGLPPQPTFVAFTRCGV